MAGKNNDGEKAKNNNTPPPMERLTKQIYVSPVDRNNIGCYRCLTEKLLQVDYSENFYHKLATASDPDFVRIGFFNDIPVAIVGAKIVEGNSLYIMTLGTLPMFERLGIATAMVKFILEKAKQRGCTSCQLHVWENNPGGKAFYEKLGFSVLHFDEEYYTAITPRGAHFLTKTL